MVQTEVIDRAHRVPTHNASHKNMIVTFCSREKHREFLSNSRKSPPRTACLGVLGELSNQATVVLESPDDSNTDGDKGQSPECNPSMGMNISPRKENPVRKSAGIEEKEQMRVRLDGTFSYQSQ